MLIEERFEINETELPVSIRTGTDKLAGEMLMMGILGCWRFTLPIISENCASSLHSGIWEIWVAGVKERDT